MMAERIAGTIVHMSIRSSDSIQIAEPMVVHHRSELLRRSRRVSAFRRLASVSLIILAGCAASAGPRNSRIQELQQVSQRIATREQQCMDAAVNRANDEFSQIVATPDGLSEDRVRAVNAQRSHDFSKCKLEADREKTKLSAREQAEYESQAREESNRGLILWVEHSPPP
jgi:hypothetical protein